MLRSNSLRIAYADTRTESRAQISFTADTQAAASVGY